MSTTPPGPEDEPDPQPANPYGVPQAPQQPHGQPAYGQPPYGQPPYGAPTDPYTQTPRTDGVSITAFVLSLTFCLSVVGLILGFVGLSRTKGGKRKGRWAAIAAIPIGLVLTGVTAVLVVVVGIFAASVVTIDEAKPGLCVDVDDSDLDAVVMTEAECSEAHDAEIVYAGDAGDDAAALEGPRATRICASRVDPAYRDVARPDDYEVAALIEDPDNVSANDTLVCYLTRADGEELTEKLAP